MLHLQHNYANIVVRKNQVLGEERIMKRLLSLAIIASLAMSYSVPAFAIQDVKKEKTKIEKITPTQNKFDYINLAWWQGFNDELLNGYIVKAIENNKALKMATLTIDEFYQNVVSQRSAQLPTINAGFLPGYSDFGNGPSDAYAFPLMASYELDIYGKNSNKTNSVRKLWESSILDERAAYISIASAVGSTYINIVKLDAMIDLQEDIVKLRKEIFEMMEVANAEGLSSTSDLVKANQAYVAGVTDLTDMKKNRSKLLHQLAVLTGDSPNNIEEYARSDYKTLAYSGLIPETVASEIIMQRPDYLKAEKMLEKAGIDVKVARKECLPSINLGGLVLFNAQNIGSLFTTSNALWGLGGGLLHPIFAGGRIKANLKSKKIAYEKSLKNYEKVNLTSMQEVNDTLVSVNMDKEKLSKQKEIQSLEKKDFELSKLKYNEGVIAKLDLNQREENLLSVNQMVYASEFDCMIDYISYYKAVGAQAL